MSKEEIIERLESIKETFETFSYGLNDIHLDIEALEYAIGYLKGNEAPTNFGLMTNREKIFEITGVNLESSCICTSDECEEECIKNGDCFMCEKWLNAEFKERKKND